MSRLSMVQARAEKQRKEIMEMSEKEFMTKLAIDTDELQENGKGEINIAFSDEPCWRCKGAGCGNCEGY